MVRVIFAAAAALLITGESLPADGLQSMNYRESRDGRVRIRQFDVAPDGAGVAVSSSIADDHILTRCDDSGHTRQWIVKKNEMHIKAIREGKVIQVSGRSGGEPVEKQLRTGDGLPWFQSLYYAFSRFVQSDQKQLEFWMIRPDNLSLVKLRAEKKGMETIRLNGREEKAQKVKLSATGLLQYIWHGYYWYRKEDGVLLQYKDMKALPGRSKLTMHLSDKDQADF